MHSVAHELPTRTPATPRRAGFTLLVAALEAVHLGWEHTHGGIVSHHLLNDPTLPAIWNGWGLVLLPALAWMASRRLFGPNGRRGPDGRVAAGLLGAALAGLALSAAFLAGREDLAGGVLVATAIAALVVRAYRVEYLLGFALGMTYTFGGILPVLIGSILALVSAASAFVLRPGLTRVWRMLRR
ncbi:hypothetical protein [Lysobacter humi (ex Lee et al. 2017)]